LCDQQVCLLSSEHSQVIVWGDEGDDLEDTSIDSDSDDDSDRFYDYIVTKTNEQEEDVIARQGFMVGYLLTYSLPVYFDRRLFRDEFFSSCQPALAF
jgi:hypothetical protein